MAHSLEIDWDAADRITLAVLVDHLKLLREEIRAKDEDGSYMHPVDYTKAKEELIPALKVLIPYYGEILMAWVWVAGTRPPQCLE